MHFEILCGLTLGIACFIAIIIRSLSSSEKPTLATPTKSTLTLVCSTLTASRTSPQSGGKTPLQKKVRSLRKRVKDMDSLLQMAQRGEMLDKDQVDKLKRYKQVKTQLGDAETSLQAEDRERGLVEEGERREQEKAKKKQQQYLKVNWDDKYHYFIWCYLLLI
jgi:hypothetical protein